MFDRCTQCSASLQPCFSICFCHFVRLSPRSSSTPYLYPTAPPLHRLTASPLLRSTAPPPLSIDSLHRRPPLAHSAGVHTSASVLLLDQPHESSDLKPSVRASPRSEREPCRVRVASTPACPQLRSIYRWSRFGVVMSRAVSNSVFISSKVHALIVIYKGNA